MNGYHIFTKRLDELPTDKQIVINTINQFSFCIAEQDSDFKEALLESDVLLPDGVAVVAAMRVLNGQKIKKIAGADLHRHLLEELNSKRGSCFYLGSSESTLSKIRERISTEYPSIKIGSFSPPYRSSFSDAENTQMIEAVNAFAPDVLFIGMTAPKQEKWAHANRKSLNTKILCSIGAVFDFYAGTVERPGILWINFGLEWLGRLIKEPKRMWKRYLYYGPVFIWQIAKLKVNR